MKFCQHLKEVVNRAVGNSWITHNAFSNFACQYLEAESSHLETDETIYLYQKHFGNAGLNEAKDIFIFMHYSGFAYSEVKRLEPAHLVLDANGKTWAKVRRRKTGVEEKVRLLPICFSRTRNLVNESRFVVR